MIKLSQMKNYFSIIITLVCISCQKEKCIIGDNIYFETSTYQDKNRTKASAMPLLRTENGLLTYEIRFNYLLMHIPAKLTPLF